LRELWNIWECLEIFENALKYLRWLRNIWESSEAIEKIKKYLNWVWNIDKPWNIEPFHIFDEREVRTTYSYIQISITTLPTAPPQILPQNNKFVNLSTNFSFFVDRKYQQPPVTFRFLWLRFRLRRPRFYLKMTNS
jgi:hypothetical protein